MKKALALTVVLGILAIADLTFAQKDEDEGPTSWLNFIVLKEDNGKPVRNASVIMHPVDSHGKQERGGMELKTDPDGKANFNGIPYGKLRVQVLASGFQTYGEDFDIEKPKMEITVKLKRPQGQLSLYGDHPKDADSPAKQNAPPPDQNDKKPD